jgi:hypothetical protein
MQKFRLRATDRHVARPAVGAIFRPAMSTISRIPEIILRQRALARSLPAFGLALASFAVGLLVLIVRV